MKLTDAVLTLQKFNGKDLACTLAALEASMRGVDTAACRGIIVEGGVSSDVLAAAGVVKHVSGQINVVIHALGILLSLPHLLEEGEVIKTVSLGAGNTGRAFDLETNLRIAEFKFIRWQGGPESIRQNALFKDFYLMAEYPTNKRKYMYVLDTSYPLKFLNGGRAMSSVLSRNVKLEAEFRAKYGVRFRTVREYFDFRKAEVRVESISEWVPGLAEVDLEEKAAAV